MAQIGRLGDAVFVQFPLTQADGVTPLLGAAGAVDSTLFRDGVEVNLAVAINELGAGEYVASFTPDVAGTYVLNLSHPLHGFTETINVYAVDLDDLDAAIAVINAKVSSYSVSVTGGPFGSGDVVVCSLIFRVINTLSAFDPSAIARVELISTNGNDIIQTVLPAALGHPALGQYQATFAAQAAAGTYYVRVYFTPVIGDAQTFATLPLDITDLNAQVIAGIFSVAEVLRDFLGILPGVDDPFRLLDAEDAAGVIARIVPDAMIAAEIRRTTAHVERALEITIATTRYACRPGVKNSPGDPDMVKGVDYDRETDPLDMQWPHRGAHFGILSFQHAHITKITRARLLYGQTLLYNVPTQWLNLNQRLGVARVIVDASELTPTETQVVYMATWGYLVDYWGGRGRNWPMLWAIDYEAGLGQVDGDIKALIGWRSVARVLSLASIRANPMAIQSQSASKDGLSRQMTISDAGPGGRFARLLDHPTIQEWTSPEKLVSMKAKIHGSVMVF